MTFFGDLLARAGGSLDAAEPLVRPAPSRDAGELIEIEDQRVAPPMRIQPPPAPPRIEIERVAPAEHQVESVVQQTIVAPLEKPAPVVSTTRIVHVPPPPSPPPSAAIERTSTKEVVKTERLETIETHQVREVQRQETERITRVVEVEPQIVEQLREVVIEPAQQPKTIATLEPRETPSPVVREQARAEQRAPEPTQQVTITIGRVIVRGETPEAPAPQRRAPAGPAMTLADYLARRGKE